MLGGRRALRWSTLVPPPASSVGSAAVTGTVWIAATNGRGWSYTGPASRALLVALTGVALGWLGCDAGDELVVVNRLDRSVGVQVRAADDRLRVDCGVPFTTRFCQNQYISQGVVDFGPLQERTLTLSDEGDGDRCARVVWLRVLWLSTESSTAAPENGPVDDPGTLMQLPADVEIEAGSGAIHGVAFPGITVRIDERGSLDPNQGPPPPACE